MQSRNESGGNPAEIHKIHHRGSAPGDERFFSEASLLLLRTAQSEIAWLLERGYPMEAAVSFVCNHHQLSSRQRLALLRSTCRASACTSRRSRMLPLERLSDGPLHIDGFNLIITLEVALSRGILISCMDGAVRDLAGLRGTYHPIEETDRALFIMGREFKLREVPETVFWLDAPVSNSGRLKQKIIYHFREWKLPVDVRLVPNPDKELSGMERVATSDSAILDRCKSWFNLAPPLIAGSIPNAIICELSL